LAEKFSFLAEGMPGVMFLRCPFTVAEFQEALEQLKQMPPLTETELADLLRWHCGLQEEWRRYAHDFGHWIADWPQQRMQAEPLLTEWRQSVQEFAPDQITAFIAFTTSLDTDPIDPQTLRLALQALEDGLCRPPVRGAAENDAASKEELPPAPHTRPPQGFDSIFVGDDNGYEEEAIARLKLLGYRVFQPARTLDQAQRQLQRAFPRVALVDLNFPTPEEGQALIQAALAATSVRVIIAVSHARARPGSLPPGVEDCCGAQDFQDTERLHRLIWRRALQEGVTRHV